MIGLGEKFPEFKKTACVSLAPGKEFADITSEDHKKAGQWMVMFWYPKDFTFVCPTEIAEFNAQNGEFKKRNAMLIARSEEHTSELQSHSFISYAVFCLKKKKTT